MIPLNIYDLHTHSLYSDGQATVEYIMERAAQLGYHAGTSDHLYATASIPTGISSTTWTA